MQVNNTKNRIIDVCIELFAEKTYDTVSLREIAKNVGIKESSVYSHYSSKKEILQKIVELQKNGNNEQIAQIDRLHLRLIENIENYKEILTDFMAVSRSPQFIKISKIVFKESFSNPIMKDAEAQELAAAKVIDILVYELIKQNIIDKKYEDLMSRTIHGYDRSLILEFIVKCNGVDEEEMINLYDMYIHNAIEFIDEQVKLFRAISKMDT